MPIARLYSAAFVGLEAILVQVETDLASQCMDAIRIIGLPDAAIKESKDRVLHAVKNSGFAIKAISCVVHLAPADIKKTGAFYDLPIALGLLQSLDIVKKKNIEDYLIAGELGLAGEIRPIAGALSLSLLAKNLGKKGVIVPLGNAPEASLVSGLSIVAVKDLKEAVAFFNEGIIPQNTITAYTFKKVHNFVDMSAIKGQMHAKRALEIAAAGLHNFLLCGPPGTGKTMLAKAFAGILPPLTFEEAVEVTNIYSLSGKGGEIVDIRPFRSPHHTISFVGMVGGGPHPLPGEVSLAHKGVLFLDELPEFSRSSLEALRQPLEDKKITISRAGSKATFPTDIIFIAAMNPCPCGYMGHPTKPCRDTQTQIDRYRRKISGPLLDRIEIHLDVPPIAYDELMDQAMGETSATIRERVCAAQARLKQVKRKGWLSASCKSLMKEASQSLDISARAHQRILQVAQTIASLSSQDAISEEHLLEAISYRPKYEPL